MIAKEEEDKQMQKSGRTKKRQIDEVQKMEKTSRSSTPASSKKAIKKQKKT